MKRIPTLGFELEFVGDAGEEQRQCRSCNGTGDYEDDCSSCDGTGEVEMDCVNCDGTGEVTATCTSCDGNGTDEYGVVCPYCDGTGETTEDCQNCDGQGVVMVECSNCDGEGHFHEECSDCEGYGYYEADEDDIDWSSLESGLRRHGLKGEITGDGSIESQGEGYGLEYRSGVFTGADAFDEELVNLKSFMRSVDGSSSPHNTCGLHVHASFEPWATNGQMVRWPRQWLLRLGVAWATWAEDAFVDHFEPQGARMNYCRTWKNQNLPCNVAEGTMSSHIRKREPDMEVVIAGVHTRALAIEAEITERNVKVWQMKAAGERCYYEIQENSPKENWRQALLEAFCGKERYLTLNLTSLGPHNTVEFRLFNGTNNMEDIKEALTWVECLCRAVQSRNNDVKEVFYSLLNGTVVEEVEQEEEALLIAV